MTRILTIALLFVATLGLAKRTPNPSDTLSFPLGILSNNGVSLADNGDLKKVFPVLDKPVKISQEKLLENQDRWAELGFRFSGMGNNHFLNQRFNLAIINYLGGTWIFADLFKESIDDKEVDPIMITAYVKNLMGAGLYHHALGNLDVAEEYCTRALDISSEYLPNSRCFQICRHNMALLKKSRGLYEQADELLHSVMTEYKGVTRQDSVALIVMMNNQGVMNFELGLYDKAQSWIDESLLNALDVLPYNSLDWEKIRSNKAQMLRAEGAFEASETMLIENKKAIRSKIGAGHIDYANTLVNLASVYAARNQNAKALITLDKAALTIKKIYGADHLLFGDVVLEIGLLYEELGYYRQARYVYQEVLKVRKKQLGEKHLLYQESLVKMAVVEWEMKKYDKAQVLFEQAMAGYIEVVKKQFPALSSYEKEKLWAKLRPNVMKYYSFVLERKDEDPELVLDLYQMHVLTKGILFASSNKVRATIKGSGDAELIRKFDEWIAAKERLSDLYSSSSVGKIQEADSLEVAALELEKELSKASRKFGEEFTREDFQYEDLRKLLSDKEAFVEILRVPLAHHRFTGEVDYVAMIMTAQDSIPRVVKIEGRNLENRMYFYYRNAMVYRINDKESYGAFWQSIDQEIGTDIDKVYLSVDGVYNKVNVSTLRDDDSYVFDKYRVVSLPSSRDLEAFKNRLTKNSQNIAALFGNPDYGTSGEILELPGTLTEVNSIETILNDHKIRTEKHVGGEATEDFVKETKNPSILHIAAHGYFLENLEEKDQKSVFGVSLQRAVENPLLRCGLLLAHAEKLMDSSKVVGEGTDENNGILTAYEAMNMSLEETDVVVLSACETGLGAISDGEGVYGLQRAFTLAGAKSLVISLWRVDDSASQELMVSFYKHWVEDGNIVDALYRAQKELKEKYPHPYYWGAFQILHT